MTELDRAKKALRCAALASLFALIGACAAARPVAAPADDAPPSTPAGGTERTATVATDEAPRPATPPPATPTEHPAKAPDLDALERELTTTLPGEAIADCPRAVALGQTICAIADDLCRVAPGDTRCRDATARCTSARARIAERCPR